MKKNWFNKTSVLVTLFFLFTMMITGCRGTDAEPGVMSQQDALELIINGADVVVIDVRTGAEFAERHIPNSINWPLWEIENTYIQPLFETDATLLVICQSGNRSRQAVRALMELGFTNVYDIGGIITWTGEVIR